MSKPKRLGNHLSIVPVCPKTRTTTRARKKYGIAWKNVAPGNTQSSHEPRRHEISTPIVVPAKKLMVVATTSKPSVQGRYWRIRLPTGAFSDHEWPRLPCN